MSLPKLSETKRKMEFFCYCYGCNLGFVNDVDTMHPRCPDCGVVMAQMSEEGVKNSIESKNKMKEEMYVHLERTHGKR